MQLILTVIGISTFAVLAYIYVWAAKTLTFGPLSMPSIMVMTSMVYFFLMPVIRHFGGNPDFYGLDISSLELVHWAALLYAIGAWVAFGLGRRPLRADPSAPRDTERPLSIFAFWLLVGLAIVGVATQVLAGHLNLFSEAGYIFDDGTNVLNFLVLSYSILISLTIVVLIHQNFNSLSLCVLAVVLTVFVIVGFRFRIVILLCAAVSSFVLIRGIKIRPTYVAAGTVLALILVNFIGQTRSYGRGLDIQSAEGMSWFDVLLEFGGEVGPTYVLYHLTETPPDLIYFDPWVVAVTRLIPKFLWLDKPFPEYLFLYPAGFLDPGAYQAGIAATQQSELFLQFGWFGLPFLAFIYYYIAVWTIHGIHSFGRETRIAGYAIAPVFFGFFMQHRGYLFQTLCEYLFTFGPLLLLNGKIRRSVPGVPSQRR